MEEPKAAIKNSEHAVIPEIMLDISKSVAFLHAKQNNVTENMHNRMIGTDRQLALLKFSIEAGILLCGNGVLHAMLVARPHARTPAHIHTHARSLA